ncbi:large exoprotein containing haemagglutination activity domain [Thioploca ingrica]|uniref:Large exoprotein containing haemagglutination activity domain n=1 Tax=Thioploca ingrica TaxID=40754 RepID=A0A090AHW6_9GAMM|nr:large exoprotein containing haemagglutination activity domain [Thioploca ingrica]
MKYRLIGTLISLMLSSPIQAEITLDGSLGPRLELTGPTYRIPAELGQQYESNLFHSFEQFNLIQGEQAIFTGPATLTNVISRVTGGEISHIDGVLSSAIPAANMYFINPAGILFGPHAQINVPGSLYLSTAHYLQLGQAGRFDAVRLENTSLTVAPPSAFGFLDNHPAPITLTGSQLILPPDNQAIKQLLQGEAIPSHTLAFVGGDISLSQSELISYGHNINLISVAAPGEVPVDQSQFTDNRLAAYGTISITDISTANRQFGNVDASGLGGGSIFIRAGQLLLDQGWIFADTWRDQNGRGITIETNNALVLQNGSRITTEVVDNYFPGQATGQAGSIAIKAGDIRLSQGSQIASSTRSLGAAGNVTLTTPGTISITGVDRTGTLALPSGIQSQTLGRGNGGQVKLAAQQIQLDNEAQINVGTANDSGQAGQLSLQTNTLEIRNGAQMTVGVGSQNNPTGTGKGGQLAITASERVLISGKSAKQPSGLFSNVFSSQGEGGQITVSAPALTLENGGTLQTATLLNGKSGHITLQVDTLKLQTGGSIQSNTIAGRGQAGDIEITAQRAIQLEGDSTGISAATDKSSFGPGGEIKITTSDLQLRHGAAITASSQGQGQAGHIALILEGNLFMENSSIRTSTERADGGNISLTTPGYLRLTNSEISTRVKAEIGNGGNMILKPQFLVLNNSRIQANAFQGKGGNIDITTTGIYNLSAEPIANVITASSQLGIDGEITIHSPENDATEGLITLPTPFIDASALLHPGCQIQDVGELSTFNYRTDREGMPITPDSFQE